MRSKQVSVKREIRPLRSTWRGLETWHGRDAVTPRNRKGEETGNTNCDLNRRASLRPYRRELNRIRTDISSGSENHHSLTGFRIPICQAVTAITGADAASTWLRREGLRATVLAWATAYCAFASQNCELVTPYISSPFLKALTRGPASSTTPDKSEPSVSGGGGLTLLLPSRMSASHGPTPEAATLIRSSPAAGARRGTSSTTTTSGAPKRWILAAARWESKYLWIAR